MPESGTSDAAGAPTTVFPKMVVRLWGSRVGWRAGHRRGKEKAERGASESPALVSKDREAGGLAPAMTLAGGSPEFVLRPAPVSTAYAVS